jgi:hypothetical protein
MEVVARLLTWLQRFDQLVQHGGAVSRREADQADRDFSATLLAMAGHAICTSRCRS